jgi:4-oxalocrotonate tautomerase
MSIMPVVIIKMAKGRTIEQKKILIREFTRTITETLGVTPDMVTIMIDELDRDNIGKSGKMLSEGPAK